MSWFQDSKVRELIIETADECDLTPDQVLGVLSSVFDSIIKLSQEVKVKKFTLRGLGSITAIGHIPKRANSRYNKKLKDDRLLKVDQ